MADLPLADTQGVCLSVSACVRACLIACVTTCERVRKRSGSSSGAPLEDNKHFKGSLCDTEYDICPETQGLSADPTLFSLRLARRQSKMSSTLTLFWWICSAVCLLKSTTEDLANEPWAQ